MLLHVFGAERGRLTKESCNNLFVVLEYDPGKSSTYFS